jgi:hypothetical protein
MIPYAALAQERSGMSAAEIHDRAYATVRGAVSPEKFIALTQQNAHSRQQLSDPQAFHDVLIMYRVKIGYIFAARALSIVLSPITALRTISLLALALIAVASVLWMRRGNFQQAAVFIAPAWLAVKFLEIAQIYTPDLLVAAMMLIGVALVRTGRWQIGAIAFGCATLIRPDSVLFAAALLIVALVTRTALKPAILTFALAAVAYSVTTVGTGHPGWWAQFNLSMIDSDLRQPPPFSIDAYLTGISAGLTKIVNQAWPWIAAMCAAAWLLMYRKWNEADALFGALLLSLAMRCLIYPLPEERLYLPTMMLLIMLVAERWSPRFMFGNASRHAAS